MSTQKQLENLARGCEKSGISRKRPLPPVEKWHPDLSGDIDIRIDQRGIWYHEGTEIKRTELWKLFSTILKKEGNEYFLVTPVEKWRIQVDDVPFVIVDVDRNPSGQGIDTLVFTTNTDDEITLSPDNPLRVETDPGSGEPSPYMLVRNGMEGRLNRATFYRLVDMAEPVQIDGQTRHGLSSGDSAFFLD
ncbi:MAG: DUF1285 domain-containing protein [bacterium]